jgi:AcrR family transcriptional regulator
MNTKQKYDEKRRTIADAAIKLFLQKGVQETSIRDIAKALDISTGSLYHYCKSKSEIIDMVAELNTQYADVIREYYKTLGNMSLQDALRECILQTVRIAHQNRSNILFLNRHFQILSPSRAERLTESVRQSINFFENLLDEGVRSGEFKIENSRMVAFNIWVLGMEWVLRRWFWEGRLTAEEFAEQQADFILEKIVAHKQITATGEIK